MRTPGPKAFLTVSTRFRLTAVLISDARRVAIVNGKPYQPGETVDGAEIGQEQDIGRQLADLEGRGERGVLDRGAL